MLFVSTSVLRLVYIRGIYGTETKFLITTLPSGEKLTYAIAQQRTTLHCSSLI